MTKPDDLLLRAAQRLLECYRIRDDERIPTQWGSVEECREAFLSLKGVVLYTSEKVNPMSTQEPIDARDTHFVQPNRDGSFNVIEVSGRIAMRYLPMRVAPEAIPDLDQRIRPLLKNLIAYELGGAWSPNCPTSQDELLRVAREVACGLVQRGRLLIFPVREDHYFPGYWLEKQEPGFPFRMSDKAIIQTPQGPVEVREGDAITADGLGGVQVVDAAGIPKSPRTAQPPSAGSTTYSPLAGDLTVALQENERLRSLLKTEREAIDILEDKAKADQARLNDLRGWRDHQRDRVAKIEKELAEASNLHARDCALLNNMERTIHEVRSALGVTLETNLAEAIETLKNRLSLDSKALN